SAGCNGPTITVTCWARSGDRARLELNPAAQLERARPARPKDLAGAAGRLAKREGLVGGCYLVEVEAVSAEIRDVENVETLCEQRELVALAVGERLRQSNVLRTEVVPQSIIRRQDYGWNRLAQGVLATSHTLVP